MLSPRRYRRPALTCRRIRSLVLWDLVFGGGRVAGMAELRSVRVAHPGSLQARRRDEPLRWRLLSCATARRVIAIEIASRRPVTRQSHLK